jgi:hypothetical protein
MRIVVAFLLLPALSAPVFAQPQAAPPDRTLEALRRDFPIDHQGIAAALAGKPPEEARRLAYAGIDRFLRSRTAAVLAAPGASLIAIERRQAAMLRAMGRQDVKLCAAVGDRGFFSSEAAAGAAPAGLDDYGVALVEAAKAGAGPARPPSPATKEDFTAWIAAIAKIEPAIPVWRMLQDRELRARSTPDQLCGGAAAMHEAVSALPAGADERLARILLRSVIGASAP